MNICLLEVKSGAKSSTDLILVQKFGANVVG